MDLGAKKAMIEKGSNLNISRQCELIELNRSAFYYNSRANLAEEDYRVMHRIDEIFTEHPYYGTRRMSEVLKSEGFIIGRKKVRHYYQIMGIKAVYPKMNLSRRDKAHRVYPYLLRDVEVVEPGQVYCADITYIRLRQGFIYLVAIMYWYSRYILSWRVSISLDSSGWSHMIGQFCSNVKAKFLVIILLLNLLFFHHKLHLV